MVVFPNCKINLGLNILRKRSDGFHDLATVFYPVLLQDALEILPAAPGEKEIEFSLSGIPVEGDSSSNICIKAVQLLKKEASLPSLRMHLHKSIPTGAGLGGGSADGAFALAAMNKKFNLRLSEEQLYGYALLLGSDCPFFIYNRPCFASGRGEKLEPVGLDLSSYYIVLVNPRIHVNTAWAFSKIAPSDNRKDLRQVIALPVEKWRDELTNDFEGPVFSAHPEIGSIKETLYASGARFSGMSGSGSTVFALFSKEKKPELNFPPHYAVHLI